MKKPRPQATEQTPYLRQVSTCPATPATCYTPLLTQADVTSGAKFGEGANYNEVGGAADAEAFQGATPDLSHVVLDVKAPLTKATPTTPEAPDGGLYEWSAGEPSGEQLQLVSVLPEAEGGGPASNIAALGVVDGHGAETRNAISNDGSRIVWTVGDEYGPLYMRDTTTGSTVRLDAVQGGSGEVPGGEANGPRPAFDIASSDGSTVFFTDTQRLTADSRAGNNPKKREKPEPDLYACQMVEVEEAGQKTAEVRSDRPHGRHQP